MQSLKEKFLLFRIRAKKDPDAFGEIYDLYVEKIYRFIYFKVSSAEQAEDLTSETFLKAWQYLMTQREVISLKALLYTIARTAVIDHYRAIANERQDTHIDDYVLNTVTDEKSARLIRDVEAHFDTTQLLETIRGLKDEYREIIVMKYLDEMSTKEIADVLGKSTSNVRVILHRATKAISEVAQSDDQQGYQNSPKGNKD